MKFTCVWVSLVASLALGWYAPVIGTDRNKNTNCPPDVGRATRHCLRDYKVQWDALLHTDSRFFPGLDVEVIRSLCSSLEDSMKCIRSFSPVCESEVPAIERELAPHLGVSELCKHHNIYEDYAMNQNCFMRIRSESLATCYHNFSVSVQDDAPRGHHPSSESLSSSNQQQAPQQRHHCSHLKRLISCVKILVRASTTPTFCKTALKLVDVLVRASLPSTVHCNEEFNATATHPKLHGSSAPVHGFRGSPGSAAGSIHDPSRLWYLVLTGTVVLRFVYSLHAFGPLGVGRLRFHRGFLSPESSR